MGSDNPGPDDPVESAASATETTQYNRKGGGKTGRKRNEDRRSAAQRELDRCLAKRKAGGLTRAEERNLSREIKHWRREAAATSEEHARVTQKGKKRQ